MTFLAYIDPGVGTLLLQIIVAAVTGVLLFFRQSISRILGVFRGSRSNDDGEK